MALVAGLSIAAYFVFRAVLHSDGYALAISTAIALVWTLGRQGRNPHPVALAAAVVFGVAALVSLASGGSALPLKLRRGLITGPLGVACLVSVAIRRPLLPPLLGLVARGLPRAISVRIGELRASLTGRTALVLTAIVGLTLLADAAVQVTLALAVSTTVFVSTDGLARLAVAAVGVGACALYLRSQRSDRPPPPQEGEADGSGLAPSGAQRP